MRRVPRAARLLDAAGAGPISTRPFHLGLIQSSTIFSPLIPYRVYYDSDLMQSVFDVGVRSDLHIANVRARSQSVAVIKLVVD
jgi:hypothetical protein